MELIEEHSEEKLVAWLPEVEKNPEPWICVHVNISRIHEETLNREGSSCAIFEKIRQVSMKIARKLFDLAATRNIEGKTFIFEDGDVMALLEKRHDKTAEVLERVRREFAATGLDAMLDIYGMKEKLSELVALSAEKKDTAELNRKRKANTLLVESVLELAEPNPETTREIHRRRRRRAFGSVLVIEDDLLTRGLVAASLKDNFNVVQAKDARTGIAAYIESAPDIVFLDIHLPGLSGHDILPRLIALDPQAFIVMLSSDSVPENVLSTRSKGAAGFIRKPFSKDKILQYVKKCPTLRLDATTRALGWSTARAKGDSH